MVILGLTGSIGMGKTTAAEMLRGMGLPVYDSDAEVHRMLSPGGSAAAAVAGAFADAVRNGVIDRRALGRVVFGDDAALRRLESILHPRVREAQFRFLRRMAARRESVVVLDVPLLFEVGTDQLCDATIVVSAPAFLQRMRVLARPGMTRETFNNVLSRQLPDSEKRRRADFVVPSGLGRALTLHRLTEIVLLMRRRGGSKWPPRHGMVRRLQPRGRQNGGNGARSRA